MAVIPEPSRNDPELSHWLATANLQTRAAHPHYYWHIITDDREFFWNEQTVSQGEYRKHAPPEYIDALRRA